MYNIGLSNNVKEILHIIMLRERDREWGCDADLRLGNLLILLATLINSLAAFM